jgi:hypothetical protein
MVVNNFSRSEEVFRQTQAFLSATPDLNTSIMDLIFAYKEAGELVPHTLDSFMSGHFFPFAQSEYEIESSLNLAMQGFYGYALGALRSTLELGLLGVYFAVEGREDVDVRPWLESRERTPSRTTILAKLASLQGFQEAHSQFDLSGRILHTFEELDRFVPTRGYKYSSRRLTRTNYNFFSHDALLLYSRQLRNVVGDVVFVMLLKYSIGMQALPLTEKFGLRPPLGGFLEEYQVKRLTKGLQPPEITFLQALSDADPGTQSIVAEIASMPDLTDEEWQAQRDEGIEGFSFPDGQGGWTIGLTRPREAG